MSLPRLITIPVSHFAERARWALQRAEIPFREEPHLQVFHRRALERVGGGKQVPVLVTPGQTIKGSGAILDWAHAAVPSADLAPVEGTDAELERRFETELGVEARRLAYFHLVDHPSVLLPFNNKGAPIVERVVVRLMYGRLKTGLTRYLKIDEQTARAGRETLLAILDVVSQRLADGRAWISGDKFARLDLTFAALAAPIVMPNGYAGRDAPSLDRLPAGAREFFEEMRAHPAGAHALRCYREQRRARSGLRT